MTAPKTYRCVSYPSLQLGELKFENGTFTTAEPREQRFVERHPEFLRGAIKVADGFQVAGADLSTAIRPDPGLRQREYPVFVPEPIPPPDPRLLRALGLPVPEPVQEPAPELPLEPTLTPEEKAALNKIINGELPPVVQPADIPLDIPPLEKLPYPSIARRWGLARLVKFVTDRGIAVPEGADKDAVLDLLYPDTE